MSEATLQVQEKETFLTDPKAIDSKIARRFFDPDNLLSERQLADFVALCHVQGLNPFLKEAYVTAYKKRDGSVEASIITARSVFEKRADANPNYDGQEDGIIVDRDGEQLEIEGTVLSPEDTLLGGWAKIYRKDRSHPKKVSVSLKEFGKGQSTWNSKPAWMINKVAIVNALRSSFPSDFEGMYTEEEAENLKANMTDVTPPSEVLPNSKYAGMTQAEVGQARLKEIREKASEISSKNEAKLTIDEDETQKNPIVQEVDANLESLVSEYNPFARDVSSEVGNSAEQMEMEF